MKNIHKNLFFLLLIITGCVKDFNSETLHNPQIANNTVNNDVLESPSGWGLNNMLLYSHGGYWTCDSPALNCFDIIDITADSEVYGNFKDSIEGTSSAIANFFNSQGEILFPDLYYARNHEQLNYLTQGFAKIIPQNDTLGQMLYIVVPKNYNHGENQDSLLKHVNFVFHINEI